MKATRSSDLRVPVRIAAIILLIGIFCPAMYAAFTTVASTPVAGDIGVAVDPSGSAVYFVEFNSGSLKKIQITPTCTSTSSPACVVTTIASGFSHPEDVALDVAHNTAYVTTRDDPGTTGAFWRVDLTTGVRTLITFNLLAPHQIALDVAANNAYIVGFGSGPGTGRLWRVNLSTGTKTTILPGLASPVGLVVTGDRTRAYVTEQGTSSVVAIDIATHTRIGTVVSALVSPFFMAWADPGETGIYVVERNPNNDVVRVDLPTSTKNTVVTGLPSLSSGISLFMYSTAYISTNDSVIRQDFSTLPGGSLTFLGVGNVPSTAISSTGYATTTPGYFVHFKDCPFAGTLNIFGNFTAFVAAGAAQYRLNVSKDGAPPVAVTQTWTMARFNPSTGLFESATISPISGTDRYAIPSEYLASPPHPERWYPPFLMMRWPSGPNGVYSFTVELFNAAGTTVSTASLTNNLLTLKVDNEPPQVDLLAIYQHGASTPVGACAIVNTGTSRFDIELKAYDPNGHLLTYSAAAYWGHNQSATVIPAENYEPSHVNADGVRLWRGVTSVRGPMPLGWQATCNCAHTFFVDAYKRSIDGYGYVIHGQAHQSITIMNTGTTCPP